MAGGKQAVWAPRGASGLSGASCVVAGAGRSGRAAAALLQMAGASVVVSDSSRSPGVREAADALTRAGVAVELGAHKAATFRSADLVVISPGVPSDAPFLRDARSRGVPIIAEVELGSWFIPGKLIAVTGTNGKSTVVTLTGRMLNQSGVPAVVAGNIGTPLCEVVGKLHETDVVVAEISSFQLETVETFHADVSVLLNVEADHIDRHGSFDAYLAAKSRLLALQREDDVAVLSADRPEVWALAPGCRAQVVGASRARRVTPGAFVSSDRVVVCWGGVERDVCGVDEVRLAGSHNLENVLASVAACAPLVGDWMGATDALRDFAGLPHRLQPVGRAGGVRFIDDSKATNPAAVVRALESVEPPVVLIAGGRAKGADFTPLGSAVSGVVSAAVLIGEAADEVGDAVAGATVVRRADSMDEAVDIAYGLADGAGTVLLSPACASFDMFGGYAERGAAFAEAAARICSSAAGPPAPPAKSKRAAGATA